MTLRRKPIPNRDTARLFDHDLPAASLKPSDVRTGAKRRDTGAQGTNATNARRVTVRAL